MERVEAHRADAERLIEAALADSAAWTRLAELTDTFGPRFSGTQALEDALDWILEGMRADGLENVRGEPVMVPRWVRGQESATLLEPRVQNLAMLGLGGSVGTPADGITAEVLVVSSFDELAARADEAAGRIVLYDVEWQGYGPTVQYRGRGAVEAARVGAVASMIASVGSASLYTPHTGGMGYEEGVPRIPHTAITIEDSRMLRRMQDRGQRIVVELEMEAHFLPDTPSRNVIAEVVGSEFPDEIVVLGGHSDSWDVGQGAMDDGGGCVAAWEAVRLIKALGLRPKRTVRVALWTNEENGLRGGTAYRDTHLAALGDHLLAIESDGGVFRPSGMGFTGSDGAFEILQAIGTLLEPIGAGTMTRGGGGADIGPIMGEGVPGASPNVDESRYFDYHHTHADTMDKLDPRDVALNVAMLAVVAYTVANWDERLPR
jgi:carboxypeptidase Q